LSAALPGYVFHFHSFYSANFQCKVCFPLQECGSARILYRVGLGIHNDKVKRQTGKKYTDSALFADVFSKMNFRMSRNRSVRFNNQSQRQKACTPFPLLPEYSQAFCPLHCLVMYSISIAFILQIFIAKSVFPYRNKGLGYCCIESVLGIHNVKLSGLRGGGSGATGTPQIRLSDGLCFLIFSLFCF